MKLLVSLPVLPPLSVTVRVHVRVLDLEKVLVKVASVEIVPP